MECVRFVTNISKCVQIYNLTVYQNEVSTIDAGYEYKIVSTSCLRQGCSLIKTEGMTLALNGRICCVRCFVRPTLTVNKNENKTENDSLD